MRPRDRVYIVTGASSGIGAALTRQLIAEGALVALAARGTAALEAVAAVAPERALVVPTDLTDHDALRALVEATVSRFGALHGVVHCAGATGPYARLDETSPADVEEVVRVNLLAPLWLSRLALPALREAPEAQIVLVSSMSALVPLPYQAAYAATKAGLTGLATSLRRDLLDTRIAVSVMHPAVVDTPMIAHLKAPMRAEGLPTAALDPERVAARIISAMKRGRRHVLIAGAMERAVTWLHRLAPRLLDHLMRRMLPRLQRVAAAVARDPLSPS